MRAAKLPEMKATNLATCGIIIHARRRRSHQGSSVNAVEIRSHHNAIASIRQHTPAEQLE